MLTTVQVASACFIQPPLAFVGLTEEDAKEKLTGEVDVYVSKFKPMKNVLSGRDEKTLMKMLVEVATDKVPASLPGWPDSNAGMPSGLRPRL